MLKQLLVVAIAVSQALANVEPPTTTTAVATTTSRPGRCGPGPAKCTDACALDLISTPNDPATVLSHCSAYLPEVTVTADTPTTWVTEIVATDVITLSASQPIESSSVAFARHRRRHHHHQVKRRTATSIPNWAPDCHSPEEYSSACICYGAHPFTTTITPATVTSTVDATTTVTEAVSTTSVVYPTD